MDEGIFEKSLLIAQEILNTGKNLKHDGVKANYANRDDYLKRMVGEDGYISFTPKITTNITLELTELLQPVLEEAIMRYRISPSNSTIETNYRHRYELINLLIEQLTINNLLNNTVPDLVSHYIKEQNVKDLKSPKLSKLLVNLCGEQSEIVKWYTCTCPKTLELGELDEYRLTVSILPHHIAGMSYFASLNWGGKEWENAHNGTSCCDPIRNNGGSGLYTLAASLKEETLAIAYLSFKDHNDVFQPIYQARTLLRICHLNDNTSILIACRIFGTSKTVKHMIVDGLKNQFGNIHSAMEIRKHHSEIITVNHKLISQPTFVFPSRVCEYCGGTGHREATWGNDAGACRRCNNGTYTPEPIFPYLDDQDVVNLSIDEISFYLPEDFLKKEGLPYEILQQEETETTV